MGSSGRASTDLPGQVCFAAAGLGIVNAVAVKVHGVATHMITVHLQRTLGCGMDLLLKSGKPEAKRKAMWEGVPIILSFVAGAFGGHRNDGHHGGLR